MKIVIAPDSFKGSLTSVEAAKIINEAISDFDPSIETVQLPMADGGEGTVDAVLWSRGGEKISCRVLDPLGRSIDAVYGWLAEEKTAIIETAAASGLPLLEKSELDPDKASSFGTGELLLDALERGAERVILGLGGSATVDAGTGLFQALGVKFFDEAQNELKWIGGRLGEISAFDTTGMDQRLEELKILVASDVTNPLLGPEGAASVFGPQKGLTPYQFETFEKGMRRFSGMVERGTGRSVADKPGSGAAGGIGFSLRAFLEVEFGSGFELIAGLSGFEKHLQGADLVLTGEGRVDGQSLYGKVPVGIGRIAKAADIPVVAFAGAIGKEVELLEKAGIHIIIPIAEAPMSLQSSMQNSRLLLYNAVMRLMKTLQLGKNLK